MDRRMRARRRRCRCAADSLDAIPRPAGGYSGEARAISATAAPSSAAISTAQQIAGLLTGRHRNRDQPRRARLALRRHHGERSQRERSVVVGTSNSQAFRWTTGGMTPVPLLSGGLYSYGFGVSGDGAIVVGQSQNGAGWREAFYWINGAVSSVAMGTLDSGPSIFAESSRTRSAPTAR